MKETEPVLIAGGGPVGLVAAVALHRQGIPVIVLEKLDEPFIDQRAASTHPPTIEMLDQIGLARYIVPEGLVAPVYRFHDRVTGEVIAEFDLGELGDELAYPYVLQYEQYKLVLKILALYRGEPGFEVRFSSPVVDFVQGSDHIRVTVERADGSTEQVRGSYLVGCDGGRSGVRKLAGIPFEGFTYPEPFIKIGTYHDFMQDDARVAYRNYFSNPGKWCNLFKVNGEDGRPIWRAVFPLLDGESDQEARRPQALQARLQSFFPMQDHYEIAYANVYTVSQRVAQTMNSGRVLLAGDAAHVNNPIGGMGLNGGIHDAMALAAALSRVWKGDCGSELLDRYTRQRRKAATDFVQAQTIANKRLMEERDPVARRASLDTLRRIGGDKVQRRLFMRRAALIESLEASRQVS